MLWHAPFGILSHHAVNVPVTMLAQVEANFFFTWPGDGRVVAEADTRLANVSSSWVPQIDCQDSHLADFLLPRAHFSGARPLILGRMRVPRSDEHESQISFSLAGKEETVSVSPW